MPWGAELAKKDKIFLTPGEAVVAIRADFSQYPPQEHLFLELCRVILGENAAFRKDARAKGVWLAALEAGRMRFVNFKDLGEYLCSILDKTLPAPELLSAVCRRIFQTAAYPGPDENRQIDGVWVETGMETFVCRQCGYCCRTLDFHSECTVEEYTRWKALGRHDITEWVSLVRRDGKIVSCRIWVKPGSREYFDGCPWLKFTPEENMYECLIHEIRPEICRQYPGTRKHALMTGCRGFSGKG